MRPITMMSVQFRLTGERIHPTTGVWVPTQRLWDGTYDDEQIAQRFRQLAVERDRLEERADYRNCVLEARFYTVWTGVDELGDVQQVVDLGQVHADVVVDAEIVDEWDPLVKMRPWIVERVAGEMTASPCPSGVFAVVVAPSNAPRDEVIALLDEQLS